MYMNGTPRDGELEGEGGSGIPGPLYAALLSPINRTVMRESASARIWETSAWDLSAWLAATPVLC